MNYGKYFLTFRCDLLSETSVMCPEYVGLYFIQNFVKYLSDHVTLHSGKQRHV
jgi:hypothetical protein